jgi:hypothetical protein
MNLLIFIYNCARINAYRKNQPSRRAHPQTTKETRQRWRLSTLWKSTFLLTRRNPNTPKPGKVQNIIQKIIEEVIHPTNCYKTTANYHPNKVLKDFHKSFTRLKVPQ